MLSRIWFYILCPNLPYTIFNKLGSLTFKSRCAFDSCDEPLVCVCVFVQVHMHSIWLSWASRKNGNIGIVELVAADFQEKKMKAESFITY